MSTEFEQPCCYCAFDYYHHKSCGHVSRGKKTTFICSHHWVFWSTSLLFWCAQDTPLLPAATARTNKQLCKNQIVAKASELMMKTIYFKLADTLPFSPATLLLALVWKTSFAHNNNNPWSSWQCVCMCRAPSKSCNHSSMWSKIFLHCLCCFWKMKGSFWPYLFVSPFLWYPPGIMGGKKRNQLKSLCSVEPVWSWVFTLLTEEPSNCIICLGLW
jgi:hypothetical protein